ncbi:LysR family transcriptional regulator [Rhodoferax mekongensis]|uniref:LysR family transcriptional regulator n=1 Tax=Rhodoferax mekongensis TaxID=3068341 RepID=UPI0028BD9628|nr:LysR family transcriptional regulator [Rhodoferax sp. TBRC 17199]MDT7516293.1 LysR family transcriptional regulator [Rhodoferax sp. TBRC 17199]
MNENNQKTEHSALSRLNFHHLHYFWRVAKVGHLSKVAAEIHVSQSALSAQIRQLEDRIGEPLFCREGRRLELTDTGKLVYGYAERIFDLGTELIGRLNGQIEGQSKLRIGSVSTLSRNYQENWLRPLLSDPDLMLTLESGLLEGLLDRLVQHELDVVLANEAVPTNPDQPLHCRLLASQVMSVVGSSEVWGKRNIKGPRDLHNVEIALPGPRHAVRAQFDALCASVGASPKVRAEVDDMAMLRLLTRDSGWLALLPEVVVQDELRNGQLKVVGELKELKERFYAITAPHRYQPQALKALISTN